MLSFVVASLGSLVILLVESLDALSICSGLIIVLWVLLIPARWQKQAPLGETILTRHRLSSMNYIKLAETEKIAIAKKLGVLSIETAFFSPLDKISWCETLLG